MNYGHFVGTYCDIKYINRGGFGYIMDATNKFDHGRVAVKCIKPPKDEFQKATEEAIAHKQLRHENVVGYTTVWCEYPPKAWQEKQEEDLQIPKQDNNNIFSTSLGQTARTVSIHSSENDSALSDMIMFENSNRLVRTESNNNAESQESNGPDENISSSMASSNDSQEPLSIIYIVMELCHHQSLKDHLEPDYRLRNELNRVAALGIFYQIVRGLSYIHGKNMIHRDLTPANILFSLDDPNRVKIGDFGLVKYDDSSMMTQNDGYSVKHYYTGKPLYKSPEQNNTYRTTNNIRQALSTKVDIYALGIILFELLYPFNTVAERSRVLTSLRSLPTPEFPTDFAAVVNIGDKASLYKSLIGRLLAVKPEDRPTAKNLENSMQTDIDEDAFKELMYTITHAFTTHTPAKPPLTNSVSLPVSSTQPLPPTFTASVSVCATPFSSAVVRALYNRHESEIPLETNEIQYGQFDVCSCHKLILLNEKLELKLYNKSKQLDKKSWKNSGGKGFPKSIVWCQSKGYFLILSTCCLYSLSLNKIQDGNETKFTLGELVVIAAIVADSPWNVSDNYLRYITIIEQSEQLFLNRAYRCIELWQMETWKPLRKWSKGALGYGDDDEIRLINRSQNGQYIAMNIWFNKQICAIDFRRHDASLSLLHRIESPTGMGFFHKLELRDVHNVWLIIGDGHTLYKLNLDGICEAEIVDAMGLTREGDNEIDSYHHLHMRYFGSDEHLLVAMPHFDGKGKLTFFRLNS